MSPHSDILGESTELQGKRGKSYNNWFYSLTTEAFRQRLTFGNWYFQQILEAAQR